MSFLRRSCLASTDHLQSGADSSETTHSRVSSVRSNKHRLSLIGEQIVAKNKLEPKKQAPIDSSSPKMKLDEQLRSIAGSTRTKERTLVDKSISAAWITSSMTTMEEVLQNQVCLSLYLPQAHVSHIAPKLSWRRSRDWTRRKCHSRKPSRFSVALERRHLQQRRRSPRCVLSRSVTLCS